MKTYYLVLVGGQPVCRVRSLDVARSVAADVVGDTEGLNTAIVKITEEFLRDE